MVNHLSDLFRNKALYHGHAPGDSRFARTPTVSTKRRYDASSRARNALATENAAKCWFMSTSMGSFIKRMRQAGTDFRSRPRIVKTQLGILIAQQREHEIRTPATKRISESPTHSPLG